MKPKGKHLLVALIALALGAIPAIALAQSPFRDYKQAAADQYGTTTTTTPTSTTPGPPSTTPGNGPPATTPGNGPPETTPGQGPPTGGDEGGTAPDVAAGGRTTPGGTDGAARGTAGGRSALAAAEDALDDCATRDRKYAWITFGPARGDLLFEASQVTLRPAYQAQFLDQIDAALIKRLTDGTRWEGAATDEKKLADFAEAVGRSLPGDGPLARRVIPRVTELTLGELREIVGIVFTEMPMPSIKGDQKELRQSFIDNFIIGLRKVRVQTAGGDRVPLPLVGIDESDDDAATKMGEEHLSVGFFEKREVSTVDHLQSRRGKTSLERVLDGVRGHFGTKNDAEGGPLAPRADDPVLLCQPGDSYRLGKLIRVSSDGFPGGAASVGVLLLLGLLSTFAFLAIVERRTRRLRRSSQS